MPIRVKSAAEAAEKWGRKSPLAVEDYRKGIANPKRDWQAATLAAEENFEAGITAAIAAKRFGTGVSASSDAEHKAMSLGKGAANYPRGIRDGIPKYGRKITPVLSHMSGIDLPPPGPRGSPANIARSVKFQEDMAKFRTG